MRCGGKPVGTLTPLGSCEIISPKLAFLPPTDSTSVIRRSSKGTANASFAKRFDIKAPKLKNGTVCLNQLSESWLLFDVISERQQAGDNECDFRSQLI